MVQLARQTTWADMQSLTMSSLNGEFNNILNIWNNTDSGLLSWTTLKAGATTFTGAVTITASSGGTLVVNTNDLYVDSTNHRVGITTSSPDSILKIGSTAIPANQNTAVGIGRNNSAAGNAHGYGDYSTHTGAAATAYACYDAKGITGGTNNLDHIVGYQSNVSHGSTGTLTNMYGFYASLVNSGGQLTNMYGLYVANGTGANIVTNQYGLYVESLGIAGATSYPIYVAGTQSSFFGGGIQCNSQKITSMANGTAATDAAAFGQVPPNFQAAVQTTSTTVTTTTSSTFQSTNLTATITPSASTSRVKIRVTSTIESEVSGKEMQVSIFRGTTDLGSNGQGFVSFRPAGDNFTPCSITYIDSPATTSATTYTVKVRNTDNVTSVDFGRSTQLQVLILEEVK